MTIDAVGKLIATLDRKIEERDLGKPLFRDACMQNGITNAKASS